MMMMKSVFWWRKPEYPEETTDLHIHIHIHIPTYISLQLQCSDEERVGWVNTHNRFIYRPILHMYCHLKSAAVEEKHEHISFKEMCTYIFQRIKYKK